MGDTSPRPLKTCRRDALQGPFRDVVVRHVGERDSFLCASSGFPLVEVREPLPQQSYGVGTFGGTRTLSILTPPMVVANPVDGTALVDPSESSHCRVYLLCGSAPHMRHNDGVLDTKSR